ncbi:uncharacterized protein LOC9309454 isoform X1 [Arabidopsis lyrata subsp. lyrata]|uniref:uncharacterized protein LOC9309454 isoform X1 n=1 Tax=Arabidopsis lyrata subsp. lyrata TaxID=81972 RepID=UPI000A29AAF4|nr:uncharacterized protein LOC9309454 isoform X1 [Arabidopsis lyrata subsp. lyrata]|eukprot:XP_020879410.1 uncharacterized protein LOC9309454 isoform X1 [Arabidopsis lyrata subsp. lyrata]
MAATAASATAGALPPEQTEPPDRLPSVVSQSLSLILELIFRAIGSPVSLFSTGSGLSSSVSLPLLLARSFITVRSLFPGGSPFAVWVVDLEVRFWPTIATTTFLMTACLFSDTSISPPHPIPQVHSSSPPSDSSTLERHQILVELVARVLWNAGLELSLALVAFGSTFVLSCGIHIALMRSFTTVCRFCFDIAMSMFALMAFSILCWQLGKRTPFICNFLVNMVHLDFHSPHFFLKEFTILPNTSLLFSGIVIGSFVLKTFLFGVEARMSIFPHLDSTRLVIEVGLLLDWDLTLSDHFNSDSVLPCIEVPVRLVLIWYVTKGFVPISSIGNYVFVDVIWEVQSLFRAMLPHFGTHCLFVFPKVPLIWSGLDNQAFPVLQGSSSRLLASSALVAELVTL